MPNKVYDILARLQFESQDTNKQINGIRRNALRMAKAVAAAFATRELIRFSRRSVEAAGNYEDLRVTFEAFLGSAEKAKAVLRDLDQFSIRTPFTPEEVNNTAKALLAFNIEANELIPTLEDIGNIAAGTGQSFTELATIYGQVAAAGKLTGERLIQLQERGVPILQLLSQELRVSTGQVQELITAGEVGFDTFAKAISRASEEGGQFANLLIERSTTLNGLISTFQGGYELFLRNIGTNLLPATKELFIGLNNIFTEINDFLTSDVGMGFSTSLAGLIRGTFQFISQETDDFFLNAKQQILKFRAFVEPLFRNPFENANFFEELQDQFDILERKSFLANRGLLDFVDLENKTAAEAIFNLQEIVGLVDRLEGTGIFPITQQNIDDVKEATGFDIVEALAERWKLTTEEAQKYLDAIIQIGGSLPDAFRELSLTELITTSTADIQKAVTDGLNKPDPGGAPGPGQVLGETFLDQLEKTISLPKLLALRDGIVRALNVPGIEFETFTLLEEQLKAIDAQINRLRSLAANTRDTNVVDKILFGSERGEGAEASARRRFLEIRRSVTSIQDAANEAAERQDKTFIERIIGDFNAVNFIQFFSNLANQTIGTFTTRAQTALDSTNQLIDNQRQRLEDVKNEVLRGNSEIIQSEENKLTELLTQRRRYSQSIRALASLEYFAQAALAVATAAAQGGPFAAPATIAAIIAAIAGGVSQAAGLATFHAGTEYAFGNGSEFLALIKKGERIFTDKQNARIGAIGNEEAANVLEMWNKGLLIPNTDTSKYNEMVSYQGKIYTELQYISRALEALEINYNVDQDGFSAGMTKLLGKAEKLERMRNG